MSAFDKVIGYDSVKEELLQICDMVKNRACYERMGARLPHGLLLDGDPGLGKTLMVQCFIEECGLKAFTVRRDSASSEFSSEIKKAYMKAAQAAPAIVFLDDMDKFANEDYGHRDAGEYVAIQALIDEYKNRGVFTVATTNDIDKLPRSLVRSGRFDRKLVIFPPSDRDAELIIRHYLSGKKLAKSVDLDDLAKMISYSSCAKLETIINEAAVELSYSEEAASGCVSDLRRAAAILNDGMSKNADMGLSYLNVTGRSDFDNSDEYSFRAEAVLHAELERCMLRTREILIRNKAFLDAAARDLEEKETLLYSDIRRLREDARSTEEAA